jgi:hypothetical protein
MNRLFAAAVAIGMLSLAGCVSSEDADTNAAAYPYQDSAGLTHFQAETTYGPLHAHWTPGGIGKVQNRGTQDMTFDLPEHFLSISGQNGMNGSFGYALGITLTPDESAFFLAPPDANAMTVSLTQEEVTFNLTDAPGYVPGTDQIVSGENVWDLSAYQEANFPHRTPGQPNYYAAAQYFAEYFEELGLDVEMDPYGTHAATLGGTACVQGPLGPICPESVMNVVATKPGTDPDAGIIFVAGGHYDMVPGTTHAAFDDTSGVVSTMELARVMSQYDFKHTLKFAVWGGEENGILGSQFWIQSNPDARVNVKSYWNLDVVGMSWPAPIVKPDPIVIAAGIDVPSTDQDGTTMDPISQELLAQAQELQQEWFAFPETATDISETGDGSEIDLWHYEGIASGQVAGYAGVNAQSDHTPFAAAGIPAFFIFNGDTLAGDNPVGIHNERDTLNNMTKYGYYAQDFVIEDPTWESDEVYELAKQITAQSWETILYFPFYHTILQDMGYFESPGLLVPVGDVLPL